MNSPLLDTSFPALLVTSEKPGGFYVFHRFTRLTEIYGL